MTRKTRETEILGQLIRCNRINSPKTLVRTTGSKRPTASCGGPFSLNFKVPTGPVRPPHRNAHKAASARIPQPRFCKYSALL